MSILISSHSLKLCCASRFMSRYFFSSNFQSEFNNAGICEAISPPKFASDKTVLLSQVDFDNLPNIALTLYKAGIKRVDAECTIPEALQFNPKDKILSVMTSQFVLKQFSPGYDSEVTKNTSAQFKIDKNVTIIAFGKAVSNMVYVTHQLLGEHVKKGIVVLPTKVIKHDNKLAGLSNYQILDGGSAVVNCEKSHEVGKVITGALKQLGKNDLLITLLSGGGSYLVSLPRPPITLQDKVETTQLLNSVGMSMIDMMRILKNLSLIKAGGLAYMAQPAKVVSLTLSSLPHSKAFLVAGGPTSPDFTTAHQCLDIFRRYNLQKQIPQRVMTLLETESTMEQSDRAYDFNAFMDVQSGPKSRYDTSNAVNIIAGSDDMAVGGILDECCKMDIPACHIETRSLHRPTTQQSGKLFADVSNFVAGLFLQTSGHNTALVEAEFNCIQGGLSKSNLNSVYRAAISALSKRRPLCIIFNSELKIELKDDSGMGGPCQEAALATSIELARLRKTVEFLKHCDVRLFSIDSDGLDGPTDVAGAVADPFQADELVEGHYAQHYLNNNDSYTFYKHLHDGKYHIKTGPTGTDIQNFQILLIRKL